MLRPYSARALRPGASTLLLLALLQTVLFTSIKAAPSVPTERHLLWQDMNTGVITLFHDTSYVTLNTNPVPQIIQSPRSITLHPTLPAFNDLLSIYTFDKQYHLQFKNQTQSTWNGTLDGVAPAQPIITTGIPASVAAQAQLYSLGSALFANTEASTWQWNATNGAFDELSSPLAQLSASIQGTAALNNGRYLLLVGGLLYTFDPSANFLKPWMEASVYFMSDMLYDVPSADTWDDVVNLFGGKLWLTIVVIAGVFIFIVLSIVAMCMFCRRSSNRNNQNANNLPQSNANDGYRMDGNSSRMHTVHTLNGITLGRPAKGHTLIKKDSGNSFNTQTSSFKNDKLDTVRAQSTLTRDNGNTIAKSSRLIRQNTNNSNTFTSRVTTTTSRNTAQVTAMSVEPNIEFALTPEEEAKNEQEAAGISLSPKRPPATSGATTLINQGETIALPGFLKMDFVNDIRLGDKLAEGGGGVVHIADLLNEEAITKYGREKVVVKTLKQLDSFSREEFETLFRQEVTAMWALHHHKNIVGLIGFSEEPYTIVLKRYDRSLFDAVLDRRLEINAQTTLFFCYCIADGMAEMHQLGMIHRDLKSANILVDLSPNKPLNLVISDFGLVRVAKTSEVSGQRLTTAMGISYRYASPEAFNRLKSRIVPDAEEDKASDVYAFAIIAWELMERKVPWGRLKNDEIQNLVCSNVRLEISPHFRTHDDKLWSIIIKLVEACWAHKPHSRPKFRDIGDKLRPWCKLDRRRQ